jgi:chromatin remodeling complex protein RSC6
MSSEIATKPVKTIRKKIAKTVEPIVESVSLREAPVVEPTPEDTAESSSETETESFRVRLDSVIKSNNERIAELKSLNLELKKLQKEHEVQLKLASKKKKKVIDPNAPKRKLTGFAAPCKISKDLHDFLVQFGVGQDDLVSGTSVSSYMHRYLKSQNLADPEHNKEFIPDAALKKLLAPSDSRRIKDDPNSPFVYKSFEIQKYIKHHFLRSSETA